MRRKSVSRGLNVVQGIALFLILLPTISAARDAKSSASTNEQSVPGVLWREPTDIASRDLFYGPGGKEHAPHTRYTFQKEVLSGSSPKFEIVDENGVHWRVKLGVEARPETVATRLLWAAGYFADEDYFLADLKVEDMPRLKRGQELVGPDGVMHNVRLERHIEHQKKDGEWKWRHNPFTRRREFNGLRVLMALMNNWDLKDVNNTIFEVKHAQPDSGQELHYEVSDLGATFGTNGISWTHEISKNNLSSYQHSKFITKQTSEYLDFATPGQPALMFVFSPGDYIRRTKMRSIGKHVPRADAKWMESYLGACLTTRFTMPSARPDIPRKK